MFFKFAMEPIPADARVLCYGDSLTAGYTALTQYTGEYAPWATHLGDALGLRRLLEEGSYTHVRQHG